MFNKLAELIAEIMNVDPSDIDPRTPLRANDGLDALDFARLIIAAEKKFRITIYDVDAANFFYMEDMRDMEQEELHLMMLNSKNALIRDSLICKGTVSMS